MEDPETGEQLFVDTSDKGFRQRFEAMAIESERALQATFTRLGVDALTLRTDQSLLDSIAGFAQRRKRERGQSNVNQPAFKAA